MSFHLNTNKYNECKRKANRLKGIKSVVENIGNQISFARAQQKARAKVESSFDKVIKHSIDKGINAEAAAANLGIDLPKLERNAKVYLSVKSIDTILESRIHQEIHRRSTQDCKFSYTKALGAMFKGAVAGAVIAETKFIGSKYLNSINLTPKPPQLTAFVRVGAAAFSAIGSVYTNHKYQQENIKECKIQRDEKIKDYQHVLKYLKEKHMLAEKEKKEVQNKINHNNKELNKEQKILSDCARNIITTCGKMGIKEVNTILNMNGTLQGVVNNALGNMNSNLIGIKHPNQCLVFSHEYRNYVEDHKFIANNDLYTKVCGYGCQGPSGGSSGGGSSNDSKCSIM